MAAVRIATSDPNIRRRLRPVAAADCSTMSSNTAHTTKYIKVYLETTRDPKLMRLPPRVRWRFIEACIEAGHARADGMLPPLGDLAWTLHADADELRADYQALERAGLMHREAGIDADGIGERWCVTNFAKRQARNSAERTLQKRRDADAERQRRRRAKKRQQEPVAVTDDQPTADDSAETDDNPLVTLMVRHGIWRTTARRLATLPHVTEGHIEHHCTSADNPRIAAWRIEHVTDAPPPQRDAVPVDVADVIRR